MPLFKDVEFWFAKVDPARPSTKFNKKNPTWEVQLRTTDRAQRKEWIEGGLRVKDIVPDDGDPYFRVNLRKRTIKADGEKADPVEVVYGNMKPVDPKTIGNKSRGNVRVFQYDYENEDGVKGVANVLMGIQLTKHIMYTPPPRDDEFGEDETEIIDEPPEDEEEAEETSSESDEEVEETPKKKTPTVPKKKDKFD